nr:MAG TPA: hypothetical protein [Caudoviricetes sp.]
MIRKNLPLRRRAYFSVQPCRIVPATFCLQKNNPCGSQTDRTKGTKNKVE